MPDQYDDVNQFQYNPPSTSVSPAGYETPDNVELPTGGSYITPETKVASQLENLLKLDSPLMQLASTRAKEQAASLGLLSSSMAVGAGQREATKQMLPIAQQDAQSATNFMLGEQKGVTDRALAQQQGLISSALQSQQVQDQASLYGIQGEISGALADQDFRQKEALQTQAEQHQFDQLVEEYKQRGLLQTQAEDAAIREIELKGEIENNLQQARIDSQEYIKNLEISDLQQREFSLRMDNLYQSTMNNILEIEMSPNINSAQKTQMIEQLYVDYQNQAQTLASLFGVPIEFLPKIGDTTSSQGGSTSSGSTSGTTTNYTDGFTSSPSLGSVETWDDVDWKTNQHGVPTPGEGSGWTEPKTPRDANAVLGTYQNLGFNPETGRYETAQYVLVPPSNIRSLLYPATNADYWSNTYPLMTSGLVSKPPFGSRTLNHDLLSKPLTQQQLDAAMNAGFSFSWVPTTVL